MKLHVFLYPSHNPYCARPLLGLPLGEYASRAVAPETGDPNLVDEGYVALVYDDMPLVDRAYLAGLAEQMALRDQSAMGLGKGKLFVAGQGQTLPKYSAKGGLATVVESEEDFAYCTDHLRRQFVGRAQRGGAILSYGDSVVLDATVRLAKGAYVHPFVVLQGRTTIGEDSVILPFTHLVDCVVGKGATVGGCHTGAIVADNARLGAYTYSEYTGLDVGGRLHPYSHLVDCRVGEQAEVQACYLVDERIQNRAMVPWGTVERDKEIEPCYSS